jgi:protein phosphatase
MLLSSDGLHGVVAESEIERILSLDAQPIDGAAASSLQEKCRQLIEAANAAGGPDNVTVLLIRRVD